MLKAIFLVGTIKDWYYSRRSWMYIIMEAGIYGDYLNPDYLEIEIPSF